LISVPTSWPRPPAIVCKEKPVAFPDPATDSTSSDGISYINLPKLIELKLASGMTNAGRLRDLSDVTSRGRR
jgi:hypothetical protein